MFMERKINIAFDGPAACGKSTAAMAAAKALGFLYVDTGAMYRAAAWLALRDGVPLSDKDAVTAVVEGNSIELRQDWSVPKGYRVFADGVDITGEITSAEVNSSVSTVAAISGVRRILAGRQRDMAKSGGIVMAGRDITTVVMPDAELKIYLDASLDVRAERRLREELASGSSTTLEEVRRSLEKRDRTDSERADSPLVVADDAVVINSDCMTADEVVAEVIRLAGEREKK